METETSTATTESSTTVQDNDSSRGMMIAVIAVIVIVIIGIIAFLMLRNNYVAPVTPAPAPVPVVNPPAPVSSSVSNDNNEFILTAQNGSEQDGTAVLTEVGSQVQVTLHFPTGVSTPEPAHIHMGSCPTPGTVVFPLTDVVDGASVTMLDTSISALKALGNIAINVHKSAAESSVYMSCGDIVL
ncbi:MAG: CHRD domain-containing protein [Candidatus Dojkabacteria bacterium]